MMLHIISQAPVYECILQRIGQDNVVVLIDSAVLRALSRGNKAHALTELMLRARCCVLMEHLSLYGIATHELITGIEVIDYSGLVNLTLMHPLIQTWN
jgi:tRNA 2-thiouridine synthesizing protein B